MMAAPSTDRKGNEMTKFLALIEVLNQVGGGAPVYPDQGLPMPQPPGGGGEPPQPTHPIVIPPDGLAPGVPTHPIYIPAPPVHPSHPIVIPPDAIAPGVPTQPIYIPPGIWGPTDPRPSHPIAPGGQPPAGGGQPPYPDQGLPGAQPKPEHPIVLPTPPTPEESDKALVLVITKGNEPVWFLIDANDGLKPTHPQPKNGNKAGGTRQRK
jgi:hypothetical protein